MVGGERLVEFNKIRGILNANGKVKNLIVLRSYQETTIDE